MQCIVGRIQPIRLCRPCVMHLHGPKNAGRAVQTDPALLRYASVTSNNVQQGVLKEAKCNNQQCQELWANNVVSVCTGLKIEF